MENYSRVPSCFKCFTPQNKKRHHHEQYSRLTALVLLRLDSCILHNPSIAAIKEHLINSDNNPVCQFI